MDLQYNLGFIYKALTSLAFSMTEGIDNIVKQLTNSNTELTPVNELVKAQLLCFLQHQWAETQLKLLSDGFEKEKELLMVSRNNASINKLEDDIRSLEAVKRKLDKENVDLKSIFR
jgi:hypothetical protein